MVRVLAALGLTLALSAPLPEARPRETCPVPCAAAEPLYVAIYWKARPGREAEYAEYIRRVAQPIDDEAHRAGAFEELRTYVPDAPNGEWTHLRVFQFKDQAQLDGFSAAMDAAGRRVYPDAAQRPRADELRDMVRRETWRGFQ